MLSVTFQQVQQLQAMQGIQLQPIQIQQPATQGVQTLAEVASQQGVVTQVCRTLLYNPRSSTQSAEIHVVFKPLKGCLSLKPGFTIHKINSRHDDNTQ